MDVNSKAQLQPIIKSTAGSKKCLVGLVDAHNNFIGLNQHSVVVVDSLDEAKAYLRAHHIFSAFLEFESAGDDRYGMPQSSRNRQRIYL